MPVVCVGKRAGYSMRMNFPKHSDIFWSFCKHHFSSEICEGLKGFHRSPTTLALLYESLKKYDGTPPKSSNDQHMKAAEAWCRQKFIPPSKMPIVRIDDLTVNDLPHGTSPGLPYTSMGFKTKFESWDLAFADACSIISTYEKGGSVKFPPCLAFCRTKVVEKDKPKIRFIFGVSLQVLILQLIFFKPLWEYQLAGNTPAAYKNTPFYGGYSLLLDEMYESGACIEKGATAIMSDFKNYDTMCGYWLSRRIYSIIEDCLDFETFSDGYLNDHSEAYKRLFYDLMRHDIETDIAMPDGYLWRKYNGDSTGSRAFQIMQNIRTCYINQSAHHFLFGRLAPFMKSLGDDCIWSDHLSHGFDFEKANQYVTTTFGPSYNTSKSSQTTHNSGLGFLGRQFSGRSSTRTMIDCVLSLLYPENSFDTFVLYAQRVISLYYENGVGDTRVSNFLHRSFEWIPEPVRTRIEKGLEEPSWSRSQIKRFERMGFSAPPKLSIPSRMKMYYLINEDKGFFDRSYFCEYYDVEIVK